MSRNAELFERAKLSIPGGVNSPVRAFGSVGGTPRFVQRAQGAYFWDADDKKFIETRAQYLKYIEKTLSLAGDSQAAQHAQEILKLAGKDIELRAVPTEQSDLSAVRPPYAVLDNFILRIIEVYDMPDWKESLKEYMDERTED
mgnify:CR=1 FL=1